MRVCACVQTLNDCEVLLGQQHQDSGQLTVPDDISSCISRFQAEFETSMSDDMHTPVVLAAMSEPLKTINDLLHTRKVCSLYMVIIIFVMKMVREDKGSRCMG